MPAAAAVVTGVFVAAGAFAVGDPAWAALLAGAVAVATAAIVGRLLS